MKWNIPRNSECMKAVLQLLKVKQNEQDSFTFDKAEL
jgi:hypothetical protein